MMDAIKTVGVLGLGVMGFDIAFLYAQKGYRALVFDASADAMNMISARRDRTIDRLQRRKRITDTEIENVRSGMVAVDGVSRLASADLVTEAVSESAGVKKAVYRALVESGFKGILTTNTSSLCRSSLAAEAGPERFATTHFFNPVLYTEMVEVVGGDMDRPKHALLLEFLRDLGRKPIETRDISGFVSNSVLMVYAVMALRLLEAGAAIETVDGAARELRALPPLFSYDSWKPSIVQDVTRVMHEFRGDEFLRSSKLLAALARSNPPFYREQKPNSEIYRLREKTSGEPPDSRTVQLALMTSVRLAAARTVELGEAPTTVDFISTEGLKFPRPPLADIDGMGAAAVLHDVEKVNSVLASDGMRAPDLLRAMADQGQKFYVEGQDNPWVANFLERMGRAGH